MPCREVATTRGVACDIVWGLLKQTYAESSEDDAARLAAALASIFSLAPFAIGVAGLYLGRAGLAPHTAPRARS